MKHEITSHQTKLLLANALKSCMESKAFSKVTVTDLITACGVNRNTFYYHFDDIYSLLKWMFEQETVEIIAKFDLMTDYEEAILFVLDYVNTNTHIISCAYDAIGRDGLKRFFYDDFFAIIARLVNDMEQSLKVQSSERFKEFLTNFYTEALAGMLLENVTGKKKYSPNEFVEYIDLVFKASLPQALILDSEKQKAARKT